MKIFIFVLLILAAALDVGANLLLEKSDGFKHKQFGIPALIMICMAFTLLAQTTKYMDLSIAYITWGAMAILATIISAKFLFGHQINKVGWIGIVMILSSIVILN